MEDLYVKVFSFRFVSFLTIYISIALVFSCNFDYNPDQSQISGKSYNYYFKAIVRDSVKRAMSEKDLQAVNNNIAVLENEINAFMLKINRSESYDLNSKAELAAEIMVNENISTALYNLDELGVMTQFSFNEMLYDNIKKEGSVEEKEVITETCSVYTFDGRKGSGHRSWISENLKIRSSEGGISSGSPVVAEVENGISMEMINPELAVNFYSDVYQSLEKKASVKVSGDESSRRISLGSGLDIEVEYDLVADGQKGWKKKFKKATSKFRKAWASASDFFQEHGPKIYGVCAITVGVTMLAVWYGPAVVASIVNLNIGPLAAAHNVASWWYTPFAIALITSGYYSIQGDEFIFECSVSY